MDSYITQFFCTLVINYFSLAFFTFHCIAVIVRSIAHTFMYGTKTLVCISCGNGRNSQDRPKRKYSNKKNCSIIQVALDLPCSSDLSFLFIV